jgi:hypothetical protein
MIRLLLTLHLLILAAPSTALACRCAPVADPEYGWADRVLIVRILDVDEPKRRGDYQQLSSATFEVVEALRGEPDSVTQIFLGHGLCPDRFVPGSLYLVAADSPDPIISGCRGSFAISEHGHSQVRLARARAETAP